MEQRSLSPAQVGLVFDLDNTLIASQIDFTGMRQAVISRLEASGITVKAEERTWTVGRLASLAQGPQQDSQLYDKIWQIINDYEVAGMADATLEPGAAEVLLSLKAKGFPLAVLTNNSRVSALQALEEQNLTSSFVAIFARDDVPALKPAPDGLFLAIKALEYPARTFMVGDSWLDGAAAAAAGVFFIAVGDVESRRPDIPVWRSVTRLDQILQLELLKPASGSRGKKE